MKLILIALSLACCHLSFGQGRFATEEFKSLIGMVYKDVSELLLPDGYAVSTGTLISAPEDPEKFVGTCYSNGTGTGFLVLFERIDEDESREILDVLVIEQARPGQEVKIGECSYGESVMPGLIALVNGRQSKRLKALKVWNMNRDKVRIEPFAAEKVTCIGMMGQD